MPACFMRWYVENFPVLAVRVSRLSTATHDTHPVIYLDTNCISEKACENADMFEELPFVEMRL